MKKKSQIFFLIILSAFVFGKTVAQNPIPNNDFELWSTDSMSSMTDTFLYDHPTGWYPFMSAFQWAFSSGNGPLSCYKSTSAYTGTYALNLTVDNDSVGADMMTFFASTKRPLTLNGYYKFTGVAGDTSSILVGITKGNPFDWLFGDSTLEVGRAIWNFAGASVNTYQPFSIPITYKDLTTAPDSGIIMITSTVNFGTSIPGQKLWVDNLYFSGTSDVEEALTDKNIRIYPNPVRDILSIDVWGDFPIHNELEVVDMLGKTVYSGGLEANFSKVKLSELENGIYVLRLKNENGIFSKKIFKW